MDKIKLLFCSIFCLFFASCNSDSSGSSATEQYNETTQELINLVNNDARIKSLLEAAIAKGVEINPDKETNPVQSLEDYYEFVDRSQREMPWNIITTTSLNSIFGRMYQALCYCYFINCMPLDELEGENFFTSSVQYVEPYNKWLVKYCKSWGDYLSSPESWNEQYEELMMQQEELGMTKGWYEDPSNWHSFNEFFARRLASPDKRPIASPADNSIVTSPADSEPQGIWDIDENSYIVSEGKIHVKSRVFDSITQLIGPDSPYKDAFAGGKFYHAFLNANDYHRYHFPLDGTIKELRVIPGEDALGGSVTWNPELGHYVVDNTVPGWQSIETRGLAVIDTEQYGLVAVMPIGMSQVSSINFSDGLKVGDKVKKGDELGYFLFGGSDFVLVFQEKANFKLTSPRSDSGWEHILVGEQLGVLGSK